MRLVTYNIHKGIGGVDRRYRPQRIIRVLRKCQADLVLLQEVDEGVPRSRGHRQVDLLGNALDYPYRAYFPNVRLKWGHYGNAILSRLPIQHAENLDLTRPLKKRRSALHVRLHREPGPPVWVFNVHLGLAEYERRQQLRMVVDYLKAHHPRHDAPVILAGDFNDVWGGLGRRVLRPEGFRSVVRPGPTFPAWRPLRALDRIFVRGNVVLHRCFVARMEPVTEASDHRPLVGTVRFRKP